MEPWYRISAQKNRRAKILIYEQIGRNYWDETGVGAKPFVEELYALDVDDIDLHINSPGGNVFEGNTIHNALRSHPAAVHVTVDGVAASIASVIAMAGDDVSMPQNAMLMIHDPSGLVVGTAADMRKMAGALGKVKSGMVAAYQLRADLTDDEISDMMSAETWLTAQDALDYGFADSIIEPVKIEANFQALADFKNVPAGLLRPPRKPAPYKNKIYPKPKAKKELPPMEITLELIQNKHPQIIEAILAAATLEQLTAHQPQIIADLRAAGVTAETARVQAVRNQLIPGHEALIEGLMFDGQTTGEQAAVQVLAAEKKLRNSALADHRTDSPPMVPQPAADDDPADVDANLPLAARCEALWKKDAKLQAEFNNNYDAYLAYQGAVESGKVRRLHRK